MYTDRRELIKQFSCPLTKSWSHLSLTDNDFVRFCSSCTKEVLGITSLDEQQMIAVFEVFPEQCSYLNFDEAHAEMKIEGESHNETITCGTELNTDLPIIQTARGIKAINDAIHNGHFVDIRETNVTGATCWDERWVRGEDGLVRHANQYSSERAEFSTRHPQGYLKSPLSAYTIPADLAAGTAVYVTDIIEHVVETVHHSERRLSSGRGVWNGESLIIDMPEIQFLIG